MGIAYNSSIVRDGLVLHLDAANPKSYPGSGTVWKDLSGLGNDGTINSTVSFEPIDNLNAFYFNSAGETITAPLASGIYNRTWEVWHRREQSVNTYNMFMGTWSPYFGFNSSQNYHFSCSIGGQKNLYTTGSLLLDNTWYCASFTTAYDGSNTTMSIYVNGEKSISATYLGAPSLSAQLALGDGRSTSWYRFQGHITNARVYDKTLSDAEIKQNFEALRGRYGI